MDDYSADTAVGHQSGRDRHLSSSGRTVQGKLRVQRSNGILAMMGDQSRSDSKARREESLRAYDSVRSLRNLTATSVGAVVAEWLSAAYDWHVTSHAPGSNDWILARREQRLFMRALSGDHVATWIDAEEVALGPAVQAYRHRVLVAPAGVPDPAELAGTLAAGVVFWGPIELETVCAEQRFEVGRIRF